MLKYFTSKFKGVYSEGIVLDVNWPESATMLYVLLEPDIYQIHLNCVDLLKSNLKLVFRLWMSLSQFTLLTWTSVDVLGTSGHMFWTSSGNTFGKICSIRHWFQFDPLVPVGHSLIEQGRWPWPLTFKGQQGQSKTPQYVHYPNYDERQPEGGGFAVFVFDTICEVFSGGTRFTLPAQNTLK